MPEEQVVYGKKSPLTRKVRSSEENPSCEEFIEEVTSRILNLPPEDQVYVISSLRKNVDMYLNKTLAAAEEHIKRIETLLNELWS